MLLGSSMGFSLHKSVKEDPLAVQAQFLEKGAAGGSTGINYIRSLITVSHNIAGYWKSALALYQRKGDIVVSGTGLSSAVGGSTESALLNRGPTPRLLPAASAAPSCPASPASHSLYSRLSHDVSLVVHMASVLINRAYNDDDLSPVEVRLYHRHQARHTAHVMATAAARGVAYHGTELSITAWLQLRQSLLDTIATLVESAAACGLFSAKEIQAQAESELLEVLVGGPGPTSGSGSRGGDSSDTNTGGGASSGYSSGSNSDAPASKAFALRMEALRQLAQLHHKSDDNSDATGGGAGGSNEGALDVPLTRLVWLLRDLADMSPLLDGRPDLVLLCLNRKENAENMLRMLLQTSLAIPLGETGEEDTHRNAPLHVPLFHHRYHATWHHRNLTAEGSAVPPDRHAHINDDHSRVRDRVHSALTGARADLLAACVTIMQILSTDSSGESKGAARNPPQTAPMQCEAYFQSLLDALLLRCVPPELSRSPTSSIAVLLGAHQDAHTTHAQEQQHRSHKRLRTHEVSPLRCASMISGLMQILAAHTDDTMGAGGADEAAMSAVDEFGMPVLPRHTERGETAPMSPIQRLRQRLALRLFAVRTYVFSSLRLRELTTKSDKQLTVGRPGLAAEAGRVLQEQYLSLSAASALQHLLHMAPHAHDTGFSNPGGTRGVVWALGLMERAEVLQELARLAPARVLTHDGDVKIEGILARTASLPSSQEDSTSVTRVTSTPEAKLLEQKWASLSAREEREQWQRHVRLILPPCIYKSTSSGHQVARRLYDLHLTRLGSLHGEVSEAEVLQARAALQAMCEAGEWELGVSVAASMKAYYGNLTTRSQGYASSTAVDTAATYMIQQQLQRYRSLVRESDLSLAIMKRNLLHEADARLLPVYYAVRILNPGWLNVPAVPAGGTAATARTNEEVHHVLALEALAAATHCDVVGVLENSEGGEDPEPDNTPSANSSEAWVLLRYDLSSHTVGGQAYRHHAHEMSHYVSPMGPPPPDVGLPECVTANGGATIPRDVPATPLPPSCLPVIERGLALAFPSHAVSSSNTYLTPAFSHVADDHLAGRGGSLASEYSAPHIAAKIIQVFEAVPTSIVDDYYTVTQRAQLDRAIEERARKEQTRYAANKRGVVQTHDKKGKTKTRGNKNKTKTNTRSGASASSGHSDFGSSFENFAADSEGGGGSDGFDGFSASVSGESAVSGGDDDEYHSSRISKKTDALEAQLGGGETGTREGGEEVEISDPSFTQASHADSFYIYTVQEAQTAGTGGEEGEKTVRRWRMDVLSASKGRNISKGHHPDANPSVDASASADSVDDLDLDNTLFSLHYLSPLSMLHCQGKGRGLSSFEAGREVVWYQQKQLKRLATALKKCSTLTPGEIAHQTSRDVGNLESVLAGAASQLLNMLVEPHRASAVGISSMRSLVAGEIERLETAKQLERKLLKREWMRQSASQKEANRHGFFDEEPPTNNAPPGPNFGHLEAKYASKKREVEAMNRVRIDCIKMAQSCVKDFRSCVELVHRVLSDEGSTQIHAASGEQKTQDDMSFASRSHSSSSATTLPHLTEGAEMDEDDAFLTETWTQICMALEANLASLDIGCAI